MSKTTSAFLFKFLMTLVFAGTASFGIIDGNAFKWVFLVGVLGTFRHIRYSNRLFNRRLAYTTTKVGNLIGAIK